MTAADVKAVLRLRHPALREGARQGHACARCGDATAPPDAQPVPGPEDAQEAPRGRPGDGVHS